MMHRGIFARALPIAVFAALAGAAEAQEHWGAVAAGPDGAMARAVAQPSRAVARDAAIKACGGRCTYLVTFYRSCGAIATGVGGYGWAVVAGEREASEGARRFCARKGQDCRVRVAACSGND